MAPQTTIDVQAAPKRSLRAAVVNVWKVVAAVGCCCKKKRQEPQVTKYVMPVLAAGIVFSAIVAHAATVRGRFSLSGVT
jgi:hypothetical protein